MFVFCLKPIDVLSNPVIDGAVSDLKKKINPVDTLDGNPDFQFQSAMN